MNTYPFFGWIIRRFRICLANLLRHSSGDARCGSEQSQRSLQVSIRNSKPQARKPSALMFFAVIVGMIGCTTMMMSALEGCRHRPPVIRDKDRGIEALTA